MAVTHLRPSLVMAKDANTAGASSRIRRAALRLAAIQVVWSNSTKITEQL